MKIFSTDGVTNFKALFSGFLHYVQHLINLSSCLFLWFSVCGLVKVLFLSLVV